MWYCYQFGETYGQSYGGSVEYGNDNDTPFHTNLYSLYGGQVTDTSYHPWGGQVGVRTTIEGINNNQPVIYYMQHLDLIDGNVHPGQNIDSGTYLGLSGGQIGYGYHPEDPKYTTGPHTETGFGAPWINGAQGCSFGAPCNPNSQFAFNLARNGQMPRGVQGGPGPNPGPGPGPGGGFSFCDFFPWMPGCGGQGNSNVICYLFPQACNTNWQDLLIRIILVVIGVFLIIAGAKSLFEPGIEREEPAKQQQPQQQQQPKKQDENEGQEKEGESENEGSEEGAESSEVEEAAAAA